MINIWVSDIITVTTAISTTDIGQHPASKILQTPVNCLNNKTFYIHSQFNDGQ